MLSYHNLTANTLRALYLHEQQILQQKQSAGITAIETEELRNRLKDITEALSSKLNFTTTNPAEHPTREYGLA